MSGGERRRVLFVIPTLGGGGAESLLVRWLEHWRRHPPPGGADFGVVFSIRKEGPFVEDLDPGLPTFELGQNPDFPVDILSKARALARVYREFRPDLVVALIAHANIMALLAARLFAPEVKVLVCEHTHLSTNLRDFYPRLGWVLGLVIRWLYPAADKIVAVSRGVKSDLVNSFGLRPENIEVIYNFIEPDLVAKKAAESPSWPIAQSVPAVLGVGRFVRQKGFVHLLRAFALARREVDARLILVGTGPLQGQLERQTRSLGLGEVVHFAGFQKNPIQYMARASVFAAPSLYEGFGIVLLEAMAAGVPVLATRCPSGPDEIIEDGRSGLLVDVGDEKALARRLVDLLKDPQLRRTLVAGGRRRVADFPFAAHMRAYTRLIFPAAGPPP